MLQLSTQYQLSKAHGTERQHVEGILTDQERRIRNAFMTFLGTARSDAMLKKIKKYLGDNNINGAQREIDQHIVALGRVIPQAFVDAATVEAKAISARAKVAKAITIRPSVEIGFDPSNARAATLMRSAMLQFIQQFTDSQRNAIRVVLASAYGRGLGTNAIAQELLDSIGLTQSQMETVDNYRALLENGSSEALSRELRDRRYDSSVTRAVDGEPLDSDQIDRMVSRYQDNMLSSRAETIARTEGLGVVSQAREEATRQVMEQAGFGSDEIKRTWNTTMDGRERESHAEMNGQVVGIDEPFVTPDGEELMYPGDPSASAKERCNCRCVVTYDVA